MKQIKDKAQWESMKNSSQNVCVLFSSHRCSDCRIIEPILPALENQYEEDLAFYNADRDEYPEIYGEELITGIPSFIIFKKGKEIHRWVSTLSKTREEIEAFLEEGIRRSKEEG